MAALAPQSMFTPQRLLESAALCAGAALATVLLTRALRRPAPPVEALIQRTPVQPVWPLRRLSAAARRARHTLPWRSWIAA
jgi:hypothetical protein